jgi:3-deoxy-D-manno-octulosonate 8-phosphate phosphatase (KDO 8-P phosphatase)|tara:strand:+ start:9807 stop:10532 length:726 start_codon:yes stop_codon:yes gene_type:complete
VDNSLEHTQHIFEAKGGVFITPPFVLAKKLKNIKAILFDWDGVFNEGNKGGGNHSGFSEIDSMGTNMLRFSSWLKQEESMLISAIVTGANNEVSLDFAAREHFDKVYFGVTDKKQALKHLVEDCGLKKEEIAFFYDDILDLSIAKEVGVRVFVRSDAKVAFSEYVKHNQLADYITAFSGGAHGVREACEMLMELHFNYLECIQERVAFSETYSRYLKERNNGGTIYYTKNSEGEIIEHYAS